MIVSNSSPIISLGAIGNLSFLKRCFNEVIIPVGVYTEISRKGESPEFISLQKGIDERWIRIEKVDVLPILKTNMLGEGEKEAISAAAKYKAILIIDDDTAKAYAGIMGVESHGTLYVLILLVRKKILTRDEAIDILNQMMKTGFYLSTEVYGMFLESV